MAFFIGCFNRWHCYLFCSILSCLSLLLSGRVLADTNPIPSPAAKAIARFKGANSFALRYVRVDHSIMSSMVKHDTFWLAAWGLHREGELRLVVYGDNNPSYYRNGIYASLAPDKKKVWYDTLSDSTILDNIGWKVYTPAFNRASSFENLFQSNTTLRTFDTIVDGRKLHGYAFTLPLDDATDTMIGPTTKTYLVDDDSNLVDYSSSGMAFHRWIANGAEMLGGAFNAVSRARVDRSVDSIRTLIRKEHYEIIEHRAEASFTADLPKPGTLISFAGKTPEGLAISLKSIKSKLILLDFWYSGCGYCRYALPFLRTMQAKYKDSGLTIVGVDPYDDEPEIVKQVIRTEALDNPEIMVDSRISDSLGVKLYPTFIFLDQNYRVLSFSDGYMKSVEPKFEEMIEKNLRQVE